jgi:hypothetical protein
MFVVDLTPEVKTIPTAWGRTTITLATADQDIRNIESLRELELHYGSNARLDSVCIERNNWPTPTLRAIAAASYPLRNLLEKKLTVPNSPEFFSCWEVYISTIFPMLTNGITGKITAAKQRAIAAAEAAKREYREKPTTVRSINLHSIHIHDDNGNSVAAVKKIIARTEYETTIPIIWNWTAVHSRNEVTKDPDNWITGIDGTGAVSIANMRGWKNKIATKYKGANIIIINNRREDDVVNSIVFALSNLLAGGGAIIYIPRVSSTAVVSMIHLFAQCFDKTSILHTIAEDKMFLCGTGFTDKLSAKNIRLLGEFCELGPGQISPFTAEYMATEPFTSTVTLCVELNAHVQRWRYEAYEKIILLNAQLAASASMRTFDRYLDTFLADQYADESDKWAAATKFDFYAISQ